MNAVLEDKFNWQYAIYMHVIKASNLGCSNGWNPLFCWCHYGHDGSNEMLNGYNHLSLK